MAEGEGRELKADEGYSLNAGSAEGASLDLICLMEVGRETFFLVYINFIDREFHQPQNKKVIKGSISGHTIEHFFPLNSKQVF